jgi:hypothetical protein
MGIGKNRETRNLTGNEGETDPNIRPGARAIGRAREAHLGPGQTGEMDSSRPGPKPRSRITQSPKLFPVETLQSPKMPIQKSYKTRPRYNFGLWITSVDNLCKSTD